jgi:uracil-DNA glycosylase family 4
MSEPVKDSPFAALRWLLDAGADEALLEEPVDRFAPVPARQVPAGLSEEPRRTATSMLARPPDERKIARNAEAVSLSTQPGAARALAASCTNLAELKKAVENFDGCDLKRLATRTVFADGNPEGRIMLIGEAPGRDEDREGLPFVGRAGKLLDRMLETIQLDRTKVYITNVLPWRPPQNREPSPEEAAICLPFLRRHIELVNPKLMILLGAVSVRHVLGLTDGIMRVRGRWETYQTDSLAVPVMPTLHPAYLLRQPLAKRLAWRDLLAVAAKIDESAPSQGV